ncbi:MAG: class I SAM-dependent methyltransferase [Verrucomicrobia bacterium]|nr:class I SAM-dependent methyltransferase [Verrucomicrobiota bacterium]
MPSVSLLTLLAVAWGNPGYAATVRLLRRIARNMQSADRDAVLECGSGGSTLLLGLLAEKHDRKVLSLEHDAAWALHMQRLLASFGIRSVTVFCAPLQDYGDFAWYQIPPAVSAGSYSFVVCDGPPQKTNGGRLGLLPLMADRLTKPCVILLDDTHRKMERDIVMQWNDLRPLHHVSFFALKGFTEIAFR